MQGSGPPKFEADGSWHVVGGVRQSAACVLEICAPWAKLLHTPLLQVRFHWVTTEYVPVVGAGQAMPDVVRFSLDGPTQP